MPSFWKVESAIKAIDGDDDPNAPETITFVSVGGLYALLTVGREKGSGPVPSKEIGQTFLAALNRQSKGEGNTLIPAKDVVPSVLQSVEDALAMPPEKVTVAPLDRVSFRPDHLATLIAEKFDSPSLPEFTLTRNGYVGACRVGGRSIPRQSLARHLLDFLGLDQQRHTIHFYGEKGRVAATISTTDGGAIELPKT